MATGSVAASAAAAEAGAAGPEAARPAANAAAAAVGPSGGDAGSAAAVVAGPALVPRQKAKLMDEKPFSCPLLEFMSSDVKVLKMMVPATVRSVLDMSFKYTQQWS